MNNLQHIPARELRRMKWSPAALAELRARQSDRFITVAYYRRDIGKRGKS